MGFKTNFLCFVRGHDYHIMFKYPDKPKTVRVELPKGNVEGYAYLTEAQAIALSQAKKIKYCMNCGKEKKI